MKIPVIFQYFSIVFRNNLSKFVFDIGFFIIKYLKV